MDERFVDGLICAGSAALGSVLLAAAVIHLSARVDSPPTNVVWFDDATKAARSVTPAAPRRRVAAPIGRRRFVGVAPRRIIVPVFAATTPAPKPRTHLVLRPTAAPRRLPSPNWATTAEPPIGYDPQPDIAGGAVDVEAVAASVPKALVPFVAPRPLR